MDKRLEILIAAIISITVTNAMLYDNITGITKLTAENIDDFLIKTETRNIWLTQFYAHWCGTCQNFVPKWLKTVDAALKWSPIVKVAALDCGNADNVETCRRYEVTGYPTVRLYWPAVLGRSHHDFGFLAPLKQEDIIKGISQAIIDIIKNDTFRPQLPEMMTYILPSKLEDSSFWDFGSQILQRGMLLVEENGPLSLGPSIALETAALRESNSLSVKYLTVKDSSTIRETLVTQLRLTSLPSKLEFPMLIELDISKKKALRVLRTGHDSIYKYFFSLVLELTPTTKSSKTQALEDGGLAVGAWLPEEDLYGAISYIMMREVALNAMIADHKVADLRAFLEVIIKYVKLPTNSIIKSLERIRDFLADPSTPSAISSLDFLQNVKKSGLPNNPPWKHCRGSKPQYRGYPCSLWTLFHVITAAAAVEPGSENEITVIPAIRGYITSFFGCRECAEHFANATKEFSRTPNSDSHMLIWRAHNKANGRLAGAISEDPQAPKIQYPSKSMCPECHKFDSGSSSWNEKEVSAFLIRHYSAKNIISMGEIQSSDSSTASTTFVSFSAIALICIAFLFVGLIINSRLFCSTTSSLSRCLGLESEDLLPRYATGYRMKQV